MAKEAFGGDDDAGNPPEEKKKMGLSKFGLAPDTNIRDVFWRIMGSYAATKKPGIDLAEIGQDRFALMRIALSVLESEHSENYGLSPKFLATYTLMMLVDGGWDDAFGDFLKKGKESRSLISTDISNGLRRLLSSETYRAKVMEMLNAMIRGRDSSGDAVAYVAEIQSAELSKSMKKELIILARGDTGENQLNAIKAIALLKEDDEVKKSMIVLLSHWDAAPRLAAAEVLLELKGDREVRSAAQRRITAETDDDIKEVLERIVG
ncbi:MAG TPA: hypothetical protein VLD37_01340 [Candidatus Bilamarchaeum sp.]|nr:hypothetical protein [Candidatus Bilamarchaeum sp.]